eukprot:CAMPEP_0181415920 /NCGR_PEP_ID=MMETSP1110-20121109/10259_1 /TAXON_ID=174948 /ORGANISM="Symbiodinium sp., Strain CCMP421" /LENGTH=92 /DNA_ID=CAMNT_0023538825 /DNA_START=122 /DNA_END=400 /DNA_ORIENTATION=-
MDAACLSKQVAQNDHECEVVEAGVGKGQLNFHVAGGHIAEIEANIGATVELLVQLRQHPPHPSESQSIALTDVCSFTQTVQCLPFESWPPCS